MTLLSLNSKHQVSPLINTWINGIVIQWYVAPYTDNTEWYVALMLAAGVWGGVGGA